MRNRAGASIDHNRWGLRMDVQFFLIGSNMDNAGGRIPSFFGIGEKVA